MRGSRKFCQGGGPGQSDKRALTSFFLVLSFFLQQSNGQFQRNLSFFRVTDGVKHFPGGSNYFQGGGGVQLLICLFPIETHITCDFPGGSGPPIPPSSGSALEMDCIRIRTDILLVLNWVQTICKCYHLTRLGNNEYKIG